MMRVLALTILACCATGCVSAGRSDSAICDGTEAARTAHAAALADDGGPRSIETGARLIRLLDAGCRLQPAT